MEFQLNILGLQCGAKITTVFLKRIGWFVPAAEERDAKNGQEQRLPCAKAAAECAERLVKPQLHMIRQKSRPSAKLCPKSSVALKKVINIITSNEAAHVFSLFCAQCWRSGKKCVASLARGLVEM